MLGVRRRGIGSMRAGLLCAPEAFIRHECCVVLGGRAGVSIFLQVIRVACADMCYSICEVSREKIFFCLFFFRTAWGVCIIY